MPLQSARQHGPLHEADLLPLNQLLLHASSALRSDWLDSAAIAFRFVFRKRAFVLRPLIPSFSCLLSPRLRFVAGNREIPSGSAPARRR